jgi:hypothetical protein
MASLKDASHVFHVKEADYSFDGDSFEISIKYHNMINVEPALSEKLKV